MGMYNEVYKKCPHCKKGVGYLQIHQIVLGFGGFDLDSPATLVGLNLDELRELRNTLEGETFWCRAPGYGYGDYDNDDPDVCQGSFRVLNPETYEQRQKLINELTGETYE